MTHCEAMGFPLSAIQPQRGEIIMSITIKQMNYIAPLVLKMVLLQNPGLYHGQTYFAPLGLIEGS